MDMQAETKKYKNGIDINDAMKYLGKTVTVCSRVYGISATDKITRINLGDRFPNSPLTVVIFAGSYANFKTAPGEFYKDKNICVEGKVEEYRGKAQIIFEKPGDITIK
jgi:DNA/RNA endonuclease YhcR with UshA esterase domain